METTRNLPTYDPLTHAGASAADTLREALAHARLDRRPLLAMGVLASLPAVPGLVEGPLARAVAGQVAQALLVAVVAPVVSRRLRRLPPRAGDAAREALRRLPGLLVCAAAVLALLVAPSLAAAWLLPAHAPAAAALALPAGLLLAAPLSMSVAVAAAEGLEPRGAFRRSRRLVQGRIPVALAALAASTLAVALPDLLALSGPAAVVALLARPVLAVLAALGVGAAYVTLYHR